MRKIHGVRRCVALYAAAVFVGSAGYAVAQVRAGAAGRQQPAAKAVARAAAAADNVRIIRLPPPSKTAMIKTPDYNYTVRGLESKVTKKTREWALFEVKYSTDAKWLDELTFNYHVMTKGKDDDGKDMFSYYNTAVRYIDIPKGEHMSCVAIPPSQVERYGEPVAIALEITNQEGKVLDSSTQSTIPALGKEWWKDSKVMDSDVVVRRSGMVDRSKTPFALINSDDYEVVQ